MDRRKFLKVLAGLTTAVAISASAIYHYLEMAKEKISGLLPPGQREVDKLRVLHVGPIPDFDENTWTFEVYGLVNNPFKLNYEQLKNLPRVESVSNFHCVTGWSKLENKWEGVLFKTVMDMADVYDSARFATIECYYGYTTSLPLGDLIRDDVLLAYRLDNNDLPPQHGGPLRLIVPHKYAYKSAKWIRKIKFTKEQELGYWEKRGYSNTADPFSDDRYA